MKLGISGLGDLGNILVQEIANVTNGIASQANAAMKDFAEQAKEKAGVMADSKLYTTRQQYKSALSVQKLSENVYSVTLDESAAHIEEGYESFDMKKGLLKLGQGIDTNSSKKGGIRVSKDGFRYRVIPFDHNPAAANSSHPQYNQPVQIGQAVEGTMGADAKQRKEIFAKSGFSKPVSPPDSLAKGPLIVATIKKDPLNTNRAIVENHVSGTNSLVNLSSPLIARNVGAQKSESEQKKRDGTSSVRSSSMTFRVVSEKSSGWIHPGYAGAKIFVEIEKWVDGAFPKVIEDILRKAG
jgi:hypothetical protein